MSVLFRRDQGSVLHMFSIYLACFVTGAMAIFFTGWLENLHQREQLDMIARKNMLLMETKGCCGSAELEQMAEELAAAGFENIDFSGTTTEEVGYGQEICLSIQATVSYRSLGGESGILKRLELTVPAAVRLTSTAKH